MNKSNASHPPSPHTNNHHYHPPNDEEHMDMGLGLDLDLQAFYSKSSIRIQSLAYRQNILKEIDEIVTRGGGVEV